MKSQASKSSFRSVCDATMIGFIVRSGGTMDSHPVECFYASKGDGAKAGDKTKLADAKTTEEPAA